MGQLINYHTNVPRIFTCLSSLAMRTVRPTSISYIVSLPGQATVKVSLSHITKAVPFLA